MYVLGINLSHSRESAKDGVYAALHPHHPVPVLRIARRQSASVSQSHTATSEHTETIIL